MTTSRRPQEGDEDFCISTAAPMTTNDRTAAARAIVTDLRAQLEALASVECLNAMATLTVTKQAEAIRRQIALWEAGL